MKTEASTLGGALIGTGIAALVAMNVYLVPMVHETGRSDRAAAQPTARTTSSPAQPATTLPSIMFSAAPGGSAPEAPSAADAAAPGDAALDALAADAADARSEAAPSAGGATSTGPDGQAFPEVRFEENKVAVTRELVAAIEPTAKFMRGNPTTKVVIKAHGDDPSDLKKYLELARNRAQMVMKTFIDFGIPVGRIAIEPPAMEPGHALTGGVAPGTVELRVLPLFEKKGEGHGP